MLHQLKIESQFFQQIILGSKTFEVRKNDRDFQVGDYLGLNEITDHPSNEKGARKETGAFVLVKVLSVFDNPAYVKDGFVIMSIKPCTIKQGEREYTHCYTEQEKKEVRDKEISESVTYVIREVSDDICKNYCQYRKSVNSEGSCAILRSGKPCPLSRLI